MYKTYWWQSHLRNCTPEKTAAEVVAEFPHEIWRLQIRTWIYGKQEWIVGPGVVAHIYNPSTLGGPVRQEFEVRSLRPAWTTWQNPVSTKSTKISQAWWWAPVIPATWRLRQDNCLNLGVGCCSELRSSHCTLVWGNNVRHCIQKKEKSYTVSISLENNSSYVFYIIAFI